MTVFISFLIWQLSFYIFYDLLGRILSNLVVTYSDGSVVQEWYLMNEVGGTHEHGYSHPLIQMLNLKQVQTKSLTSLTFLCECLLHLGLIWVLIICDSQEQSRHFRYLYFVYFGRVSFKSYTYVVRSMHGHYDTAKQNQYIRSQTFHETLIYYLK